MTLQQLMDAARERGLLSSPPYNDPGNRRRWELGYEAALRDLAEDKLPAAALNQRESSSSDQRKEPT